MCYHIAFEVNLESIKDYFPDINFVAKSKFQMNYGNRNEFIHKYRYRNYRVKNLRWNRIINPEHAMTSKYTMYGEDFNLWRKLSWIFALHLEKI